MRIILVRHYQTQSNAAGRILGWGDSPPCSEWRADIDFNCKQLRNNGVSLDAIFSSDLNRARQTAMTYAEAYGIAEVGSFAELKEINYGSLQTRDKSGVFEQFPKHKIDPDFVYPDGESFRQMQQRSVPFLRSLAAQHPQSTILVVSHAGVIRGLISHFLNLDYARSLKQKISFRYIGDFLFEGGDCVRYDELGQPSGYVQDSDIAIPCAMAAGVPG